MVVKLASDVKLKRQYSDHRRSTRYIRSIGDIVHFVTRWFPGKHPQTAEKMFERQPDLFIPISQEELDKE